VLGSSVVLTAGVVGSRWLLGADRPTLMLIGILALSIVALSEMRLVFAVLVLLAPQAAGEVIVASEKIPPERVRRLEAMCAAWGVAV